MSNVFNRKLPGGKMMGRGLAAFAMMFVLAIIPVLRASADTQTLPLVVDANQSSAREMLAMVNDFRTGDEAWYWNIDNSTKTTETNLSELTWDYNLEQIALQRACEIAISFEHYRPDGTEWKTCTYSGTLSNGENIAAGSAGSAYATAEGVYRGWREDDDLYAGQGHRRNMLKKDFNAIGIAHVVYNGCHYWVQEFGRTNSGAAYTEPDNETGKTVLVNVNADYMDFHIATDVRMLSAEYGDTGALPVLHGYYYKEGETFGSNGVPVSDSEISSVEWSSANPNIIKITGGSYEIVGKGTTKIVGSALFENVRYYCELTVIADAVSIEDSRVTVSTNSPVKFLPNGTVPEVTVSFNGKTLTEGVDYSITSVGNNQYVTDHAYVRIDGMGNFNDYRYDYFSIIARDINEITFDPIADVEYTGTFAEVDSITGTIEGQAVSKDRNFYISTPVYNVNVGTGSVVVKGYEVYGFIGEKTLSFNIVPKDVSKVTISATPDQYYTGSAITPALTLKNGTKKMTQGTDYTVQFSNNVNLGTATATITGIGNYTGTAKTTFKIVKVPVSELTISGLKSYYYYTAEAIVPEIKLSFASKQLTEGTDYSIRVTDNIEPGNNTATVTITGKGYYEGTRTEHFTIRGRRISSASIKAIPSQVYSGEELTPEVTITDTLAGQTVTLTKDVDYTVSYSDNVDAKQYMLITISGIGHYSEFTYQQVYINQRNIGDLDFSGITNPYYTGAAIEPEVVITHGSRTLVKNTDYTVSCTQNVNAGKAYYKATGTGNYTGTKTIEFSILAKPVTNLTFSSIKNQEYTGLEMKPSVTVKNGDVTLVQGTDYTLSYSNNTSVGTAQVIVTGKGNYAQSKTLNFKIVQKDLSKVTASEIADVTYTGSEIKPALSLMNGSVKLTAGTDYTLAYSGNVNAGTAGITVTGKGNYKGTKNLEFKINPKAVDDLTLSDLPSVTYTGSPFTPDVVLKYGDITLIKDTDYTLAYEKNTNAGQATVTVTGKGNYNSVRTTKFTISPKNASALSIAALPDVTYTGSAIKPALTVKDGKKTLTPDTDYSVSYSKNTNAGTATATVTGKGNYTGTNSVKFTILKKNIAELTFAKLKNTAYSGFPVTPEVTVSYGKKTLTKDTDYTVTYESNTVPGKATVTVTGKGNYSGSKNLGFTITKKNMEEISASVTGSVTYTGEEQKPVPVLKNGSLEMKEGVDYTLAYKDNIRIGTATITATGTGYYEGERILTFQITRKAIYEIFDDINEKDWFVPATQFVYDNGLMTGKKAREFQPNANISREEVTQILYSSEGKPEVTVANPYSDVKAGAWYEKAILWAREYNIAKGKADGTFGVGSPITRQDLAVILYQYAQYKGLNTTKDNAAIEGYQDTDKVSSYAKDAMNWAVTNGVITGKGAKDAPKNEIRLAPKGNASRAECAAMIMKMLESGN